MTLVREIVLGCFLTVFQPREIIPLREWMAVNIVLDAKESPSKPGNYDPEYSTWAPDLLDLFTGSDQWDELMIQKSSQSAFSLHVLGWLTKTVGEDPQNTIYVIDSKEQAKRISRRLTALLESNKVTAQVLEENADDLTNYFFELPGMNLMLAGAGSAGKLASNPFARGVADEVDKHKHAKGEAKTIDLLRDRLKEQDGSKLIGLSTPTIESGQIHEEYKSGSQHKLHIACPECSHLQPLVWEQVKYSHCKSDKGRFDPDRVIADTFYQCEKCSARIDESQKKSLVLAGQWLPTNYIELTDDDTGETTQVPAWDYRKMSAHHSDLYSSNPKVSWGRLALKWISAQGKSSKIHAFYNSHLGLPRIDRAAEVTEHHLKKLRAPNHRKGTMPVVPACLTMAVDNQGDHKKYVIGGFFPNGDLWIADWGLAWSLQECEEISQRPIECGGKMLTCQRVIVDEGGKDGISWEVRQFSRPLFPRWVPCKGRGSSQIGHFINWSQSRLAKDSDITIDVLHFDDAGFKWDLYMDRIQRYDPKRFHELGLPRLYLPMDLDAKFVRELCGEKRERVRDRWGKEDMTWVSYPPNDYGDCIKMLLVLWSQIGAFFSPAAGETNETDAPEK